jgi:hypothetical protein
MRASKMAEAVVVLPQFTALRTPDIRGVGDVVDAGHSAGLRAAMPVHA